jgi:hypothetical protein
MDMNKYLIVVFYIVAGCTVAVPLEDVGFSDMSSEIWAEFSDLANNNAIVNTHNAPKNSKAAVAAVIVKSENGKILVSSLFALNSDMSPSDLTLLENEINSFKRGQLLFVENINTSTIQIRGPGLS